MLEVTLFSLLLIVKSFRKQIAMRFNPSCQFSIFVLLSNYLSILCQLIITGEDVLAAISPFHRCI